MKYIVSMLALIFVFSCSSRKNQSEYSNIEYEAGACFGFCPVFKMTIHPDRTAVLEAEHFNFTKNPSKADFSKEREGTFKTTIKETDYTRLITLLDSLDIKTLNNNYGEKNITDLPTSYLRIQFKDGSQKNIEDYGKRGSEKLTKVYHFFEDLRHNQQWTKVK
ncbi:DUF6438 domain-containing protein [Chryseobacterium sp.]|uniref:DUF6438 domain-containing protein n=1 Tax=Chryseobacterium sp. TaxID=1871047 RepID=UPI0025B9F616|nr:DUF6438 domain-containing protein [Chryseobacterium sp.]